MPRGDGTGPWGMGPMTGRAAGYCAGFPTPGFMNPIGGRGYFGRGYFGGGRGFFGRGFGRGRGRAYPYLGGYYGTPYASPYPGAYYGGVGFPGYGLPSNVGYGLPYGYPPYY